MKIIKAENNCSSLIGHTIYSAGCLLSRKLKVSTVCRKQGHAWLECSMVTTCLHSTSVSDPRASGSTAYISESVTPKDDTGSRLQVTTHLIT